MFNVQCTENVLNNEETMIRYQATLIVVELCTCLTTCLVFFVPQVW